MDYKSTTLKYMILCIHITILHILMFIHKIYMLIIGTLKRFKFFKSLMVGMNQYYVTYYSNT